MEPRAKVDRGRKHRGEIEPAKVVRWKDANGEQHEQRFARGHEPSERKGFLESLLRTGDRVGRGETVKVEDA